MLMKSIVLLLVVGMFSDVAFAGELSDNMRISSKYMGYDLQYRVYTPDGVQDGKKYPVLLVVDGQWYIQGMGMVPVIDDLIDADQIRTAFVVFVDSRNPDDLAENRRHHEFMCNVDYVNFYIAELLPTLYVTHPISQRRDDTNILGLSFGAINSACFGVLASKVFSGIGMHSPGNHNHVREVSRLYEKRDTEPLRIFLSTGTVNDNLRSSRRLRKFLESQGYEVTYVENKYATHDFDNWRELLDDALLALLPADRS